MVEQAFAKEKPLFSLAIYYPLAYYKGDKSKVEGVEFVEGRQKQIVGLIRTLFLKRFESSAHAFELSCDRLLGKLLAFVTKHSETATEKHVLERWKLRNKELIGYIHERQSELFQEDDDEDADEDIVTEEMLETVEYLPRDQYNVEAILMETHQDLDQIADFLNELRKFEPKHDDKLKELVKLLKTDPVLKTHKVLIFTEFAETARYLKRQLVAAGIDGVEQIDSGTKTDRGEVIRRFAPYYNGSSSPELAAEGLTETAHPDFDRCAVRGLEPAGRDKAHQLRPALEPGSPDAADRPRRSPPEPRHREASARRPSRTQAPLRGKVAYWNFLPPDELNDAADAVRASDAQDAAHLEDVRHRGQKAADAGGRLRSAEELQPRIRRHTDAGRSGCSWSTRSCWRTIRDWRSAWRVCRSECLAASVIRRPRRGRCSSASPCQPPIVRAEPGPGGERPWTEEAGQAAWYLYDLATEQVLEDPAKIVEVIRCRPDTPRHCTTAKETLAEVRAKVERHIKNTYLKSVQAPVGVKPVLKAWMELN